MEIDLNLYKIFYTVANEKNITKAANKLYVSQPAVTKSIKTLENNLGGKLFIRTKKGVILTEEGKIFYEHVKNALEEFTNAENKFNSLINLEDGKIRIGASTTISKNFLMPFIKDFHKLYPNIDISIVNELTPNLLKDLRNGYVDFLVVNLPMEAPNDMNVNVCAELHDSFACSEIYMKNPNKVMPLEELLKYKIITQMKPSNTRTFLDNFMISNKIDFQPSIEIVSYGLVIEFIKAGFGIGYITKEFVKDALDSNEIYEIKIDKKIPKREIGIVTLKNIELNFAAHKLIDIINNKDVN